MTPQQLVNLHPWLDFLMAETLLKLDERGKLQQYIDEIPDEPPAPTHSVLKGAVTVEPPEAQQEKCAVGE